ncbi:alpha/beta fold hydrolase [Ensifer soli]|uniref:alpha/beta fold hydrolase n=1 Tax=Ciceribacter sp. sgz301302 TaxID=3342379 RepID=UPI0035B90EE3
MKFLAIGFCLLALVIAGALLYSALKAREIAARFPNEGRLIDVGGYRLNSVLVPAGPDADLPPLVFIHGASGNLRDPMGAFRPSLEGRAALLFVDRPGHGYSERGGAANALPDGQSDAIAALMERRGIGAAIVVAHSFGGAVAASLAVRHPDKVAGLVFLSPATHPWPGGVDWYYSLARTPVLGWIFAHAVALPVGLGRIDSGTRFVFAPNRPPADYSERAATALVLRPDNFRNNAIDVANLKDYVSRVAPRYREIRAPTVIVTGDRDGVVLPGIHSAGLKRDIEGSELVTIHNLGHKPDYIVTDVAIAAIERVAGKTVDLEAVARRAEARIAGDDEPASGGGPQPDQTPLSPSEPI